MKLIDADELNKNIAKEMASSVLGGTGQLYREGLLSTKLMLDVCKKVDAEPIIRCKNCTYWDDSTYGRYVGGWCFCDKLQFSTSPDWYCADGEAKTNEAD